MRFTKFEKRTIDRLFRIVFRHMSNLFIFNLAFFSRGAGENNVAESQFRLAINQELLRRGLLKAPKFTIENVNIENFTEGDEEDVCGRFDCRLFRPTVEDSYVELFTGADRWAEREKNRRAQGLHRTERNHDI